jgi:hypothetical protein
MARQFAKIQSTDGIERWEHRGIEVSVVLERSGRWQTGVRLPQGAAYIMLYHGESPKEAVDRAQDFMTLNNEDVWNALGGSTGGMGLSI